jgi:hypothetical protein
MESCRRLFHLLIYGVRQFDFGDFHTDRISSMAEGGKRKFSV